MKRLFTMLLAAIAAASLLLHAEDPFTAMDFQAEGLARPRAQMTDETLARVPATEADVARGFRATAVDFNYNWRKPLVWDAPALETEIQLVTAQGDYTCGAFSVFVTRDTAAFAITPSPLVNSEGEGTIAAERLRVLEIEPWGSVTRFLYTNMLWAPSLQGLKAGDMLNCALMVDVPKGTPAGLYRGTLTLSNGAHDIALDIALRVASFELPAAGRFGFYLNGNLYRPIDYYNCNQKSFVR